MSRLRTVPVLEDTDQDNLGVESLTYLLFSLQAAKRNETDLEQRVQVLTRELVECRERAAAADVESIQWRRERLELVERVKALEEDARVAAAAAKAAAERAANDGPVSATTPPVDDPGGGRIPDPDRGRERDADALARLAAAEKVWAIERAGYEARLQEAAHAEQMRRDNNDADQMRRDLEEQRLLLERERRAVASLQAKVAEAEAAAGVNRPHDDTEREMVERLREAEARSEQLKAELRECRDMLRMERAAALASASRLEERERAWDSERGSMEAMLQTIKRESAEQQVLLRREREAVLEITVGFAERQDRWEIERAALRSAVEARSGEASALLEQQASIAATELAEARKENRGLTAALMREREASVKTGRLLEETQARLDAERADLEAKHQRVTKDLKREIGSLRVTLRHEREAILATTSRNEDREAQWERQRAALERRAADARRELEDERALLHVRQESAAASTAAINEREDIWRARVKELEERITSLTSDAARLTDGLTAATKAVAASEDRELALERSRADLESRVAELVSSLVEKESGWKAQASALESKIAALTTYTARLMDELAAATSAATTSEERERALERIRVDLESRVADLVSGAAMATAPPTATAVSAPAVSEYPSSQAPTTPLDEEHARLRRDLTEARAVLRREREAIVAVITEFASKERGWKEIRAGLEKEVADAKSAAKKAREAEAKAREAVVKAEVGGAGAKGELERFKKEADEAVAKARRELEEGRRLWEGEKEELLGNMKDLKEQSAELKNLIRREREAVLAVTLELADKEKRWEAERVELVMRVASTSSAASAEAGGELQELRRELEEAKTMLQDERKRVTAADRELADLHKLWEIERGPPEGVAVTGVSSPWVHDAGAEVDELRRQLTEARAMLLEEQERMTAVGQELAAKESLWAIERSFPGREIDELRRQLTEANAMLQQERERVAELADREKLWGLERARLEAQIAHASLESVPTSQAHDAGAEVQELRRQLAEANVKLQQERERVTAAGRELAKRESSWEAEKVLHANILPASVSQIDSSAEIEELRRQLSEARGNLQSERDRLVAAEQTLAAREKIWAGERARLEERAAAAGARVSAALPIPAADATAALLELGRQLSETKAMLQSERERSLTAERKMAEREKLWDAEPAASKTAVIKSGVSDSGNNELEQLRRQLKETNTELLKERARVMAADRKLAEKENPKVNIAGGLSPPRGSSAEDEVEELRRQLRETRSILQQEQEELLAVSRELADKEKVWEFERAGLMARVAGGISAGIATHRADAGELDEVRQQLLEAVMTLRREREASEAAASEFKERSREWEKEKAELQAALATALAPVGNGDQTVADCWRLLEEERQLAAALRAQLSEAEMSIKVSAGSTLQGSEPEPETSIRIEELKRVVDEQRLLLQHERTIVESLMRDLADSQGRWASERAILEDRGMASVEAIRVELAEKEKLWDLERAGLEAQVISGATADVLSSPGIIGEADQLRRQLKDAWAMIRQDREALLATARELAERDKLWEFERAGLQARIAAGMSAGKVADRPDDGEVGDLRRQLEETRSMLRRERERQVEAIQVFEGRARSWDVERGRLEGRVAGATGIVAPEANGGELLEVRRQLVDLNTELRKERERLAAAGADSEKMEKASNNDRAELQAKLSQSLDAVVDGERKLAECRRQLTSSAPIEDLKEEIERQRLLLLREQAASIALKEELDAREKRWISERAGLEGRILAGADSLRRAEEECDRLKQTFKDSAERHHEAVAALRREMAEREQAHEKEWSRNVVSESTPIKLSRVEDGIETKLVQLKNELAHAGALLDQERAVVKALTAEVASTNERYEALCIRQKIEMKDVTDRLEDANWLKQASEREAASMRQQIDVLTSLNDKSIKEMRARQSAYRMESETMKSELTSKILTAERKILEVESVARLEQQRMGEELKTLSDRLHLEVENRRRDASEWFELEKSLRDRIKSLEADNAREGPPRFAGTRIPLAPPSDEPRGRNPAKIGTSSLSRSKSETDIFSIASVAIGFQDFEPARGRRRRSLGPIRISMGVQTDEAFEKDVAHQQLISSLVSSLSECKSSVILLEEDLRKCRASYEESEERYARSLQDAAHLRSELEKERDWKDSFKVQRSLLEIQQMKDSSQISDLHNHMSSLNWILENVQRTSDSQKALVTSLELQLHTALLENRRLRSAGVIDRPQVPMLEGPAATGDTLASLSDEVRTLRELKIKWELSCAQMREMADEASSRADEASKSLAEATASIATLTEEKQKLQVLMAGAARNATFIETTMKNRVLALRRSVEEKEKEVVALREELLNVETVAVSKYHERFAQVEEELSIAQAKLADLEAEKLRADAEAAEERKKLEGDLAAKTEKLNRERSSTDALRAKVTKLEHEFANQRVLSEYTVAELERTATGTENTLRTELSRLRSEILEGQRALALTRSQLEQQPTNAIGDSGAAEISRLRKERDGLESRLEEANGQLAAIHAELQTCRDELSSARITSRQKSSGDAEKLRELEIALDGASEKMLEDAEIIARLSADLYAARETEARLTRDLQEAAGSVVALRAAEAQINRLRVESMETLEHLERVKASFKNAEESRDELLALMNKMTAMSANRTSVNIPVTEDVALDEAPAALLKETLSEIERRDLVASLQLKTNEYQALDAKCAALVTEINSLKAQLSEVLASSSFEIDGLKRSCRELRQAAEDARVETLSLRSRDKQRGALTAEIDSLRSELKVSRERFAADGTKWNQYCDELRKEAEAARTEALTYRALVDDVKKAPTVLRKQADASTSTAAGWGALMVDSGVQAVVFSIGTGVQTAWVRVDEGIQTDRSVEEGVVVASRSTQVVVATKAFEAQVEVKAEVVNRSSQTDEALVLLVRGKDTPKEADHTEILDSANQTEDCQKAITREIGYQAVQADFAEGSMGSDDGQPLQHTFEVAKESFSVVRLQRDNEVPIGDPVGTPATVPQYAVDLPHDVQFSIEERVETETVYVLKDEGGDFISSDELHRIEAEMETFKAVAEQSRVENRKALDDFFSQRRLREGDDSINNDDFTFGAALRGSGSLASASASRRGSFSPRDRSIFDEIYGASTYDELGSWDHTPNARMSLTMTDGFGEDPSIVNYLNPDRISEIELGDGLGDGLGDTANALDDDPFIRELRASTTSSLARTAMAIRDAGYNVPPVDYLSDPTLPTRTAAAPTTFDGDANNAMASGRPGADVAAILANAEDDADDDDPFIRDLREATTSSLARTALAIRDAAKDLVTITRLGVDVSEDPFISELRAASASSLVETAEVIRSAKESLAAKSSNAVRFGGTSVSVDLAMRSHAHTDVDDDPFISKLRAASSSSLLETAQLIRNVEEQMAARSEGTLRGAGGSVTVDGSTLKDIDDVHNDDPFISELQAASASSLIETAELIRSVEESRAAKADGWCGSGAIEIAGGVAGGSPAMVEEQIEEDSFISEIKAATASSLSRTMEVIRRAQGI
ncbi:hypothetical protein HK101_008956 [Irineochytrium annulatum]|nr:hypothetical protein HK101_008956 [Irineochytrium annulatum]